MKSALIKLHLAVFLWGFTGVLGRLISLNEGLLVWYRILITIIILYITFYFKKSFQPISKELRFRLMKIGVIVALHWLFFYGSIKYANVSISLICLSSIAFFTAILEPIIIKRRISLIEIILSLIGVLGIALIFHFDNKFRIGIILGILSAIFSAIFSIYNKKNIISTNSQNIMYYELIGGFLFLTISMPLYLYLFPTTIMYPGFLDLFWLLILSGVCTVIAMDFSLKALQKVSAFTLNLTVNLEPVYGIILAFFIFKEQYELGQSFYLGFSLIILSVALQMLRIAKFKIV
ncbi:MAG: DMT family transporter [Chitinophagaceae bacterium]|nr:DMT family transporter [Chitinophagaceae bacterium]